jgi:hypothetical protein
MWPTFGLRGVLSDTEDGVEGEGRHREVVGETAKCAGGSKKQDKQDIERFRGLDSPDGSQEEGIDPVMTRFIAADLKSCDREAAIDQECHKF